jgi:aspartate kinase
VADPDRMRNVARHIAETRAKGIDVVAVVSAMGKATDNLVELARQVASNPQGREMDMLLTTGERISMSLLCMALHDVGCDAMSFTGSQVGIITDTSQRFWKSKVIEFARHSVQAKLQLSPASKV